MQLADDITSEDLKVFLEEAEEQLQLLDDEVIRLEKETTEDGLAGIFRAAHTLKGSSAMLGYTAMTEVAHAMESLLDKLRNHEVSVTSEVVDALLHSLDVLRVLTDELIDEQGVEVDFASLVAELEACMGIEASDSSDAGSSASIAITDENLASISQALDAGETVYQLNASVTGDEMFASIRLFQLTTELSDGARLIVANPTLDDIQAEANGKSFTAIVGSDKSIDDLTQIAIGVQDIGEVSVVPFDADSAKATQAAAPAAAAAPAQAASAAGGASDSPKKAVAQTIRIDVDRLDNLMNLIGELVIDRTRLQQIGRSLAAKYKADDLIESLGKTSSHVVKVVNDLQEDFMKVRMLPVGTVFSSFPRMMRDLSKSLDKPIDLQIEGGDTEIDRTVIEKISDPLVHMLRNALDHGLESKEDRVAAGKPAEGIIKLSAFHEQNHIVLTVQDDGAGIHPEKIKASFVKKGLITEETASRLTDSEAVDLIWMAGASTKEQATEVSGRGVGMDIVKSNIEAINGFVEVESTPGEGSIFTARLPLTLATVQSILVETDGTLCAVPLAYVLEAVKLSPSEISTISGREVFRLREDVIPLISLSEATGLTDGKRNMEDELHVVVARVGDRLAGFAVDELNEPQEIVVKSLGEYVGGARGVSGASILGDGRVVLIMDIPTLLSGVGMRSRKSSIADEKPMLESELSEIAELEREIKEIQELREQKAARTSEQAEDAA
ncbi:chemotaxis protein CheA [Candidatus Lucifugimonas marina]|uniref:Chemotaxis protein CheA n=1 Tax=Candidatus Lucifugimonas marina TaxID=3038979 RepID=A0AAJ6CTN1_9CHLR|nr:chemotaxis protein CheA [SAR202 cluster bacterium JH639]WFG35827.1 chemotaxis protein CheA [SAR202 cluster bacterium JH545]WFG39772.1 chemotaxis protein CheA [SAR202 cluster bacterium JH1073]